MRHVRNEYDWRTVLVDDARGPEGNRAPHPLVAVTNITLEQLLAELRTTRATRIRKL